MKLVPVLTAGILESFLCWASQAIVLLDSVAFQPCIVSGITMLSLHLAKALVQTCAQARSSKGVWPGEDRQRAFDQGAGDRRC